MNTLHWVLIAGLGAIVLIAGAYLARNYLIPSLSIETVEAPSLPDETSTSEVASVADIEKRLIGLGLHPTGTLGDLGVDDHLSRLDAGEVSAAELSQYATHIEMLTRLTTERGQALPARFWDVETEAMRQAGWTVYSLARVMTEQGGAVHLNLLIDAYRIYKERSSDNAVDAAMDILLLSREYIAALPPEARVEREEHANTNEKAALLIWQALLSGTSRSNPLTHKPLWSHGYIGHFSLPKIRQYEEGRGMGIGEFWGVKGFDPRFVGTDSNTNQVEHLGISTILQVLLGVTPGELALIEEYEILFDGEDPLMAAADEKLNEAIYRVFVPRFQTDFSGAAEALRRELAGRK